MKMRNLNTVLLIAALATIFILLAGNLTGSMKRKIQSDNSISNIRNSTAVVENHAPISIDGNDALATFIKDEGLSGVGTYPFPYIIENFIINASTANGIEINSTDAYLIIRNCTVEGGVNIRDGIKLDNAINVKISNNLLKYNKAGIHLESSSNNTISGNNASYNNLCGIYLASSSNNTLSGNNASYNYNWGGIYLESSSYNNTLSGNTVNNNRLGAGFGIYLGDFSSNNTLTGNTVNNNDYGIRLDGDAIQPPISNNSLSGNTVNNNLYGIYLSYSSNNSLSGNTVNNNMYGIYLSYSSNNNTIYFNNIYGNNIGQAFEEDTCTENQWDNGTAGNYWGDDYINNYPSATNDGKIWSIPYEINGTGSGIDHFPLVYGITPPIVVLNSPTTSTYSTDTITVSLTGDANHYWYYIAGVDEVNQSWTADVTRTLADGTYTLHSYGNDTTGNTAHLVVTFTIDTTAPTVIIESPTSTTYTTDTFRVTLSGDADHYWYYITGEDSNNQSWKTDVTRTLADGTYTLHGYGNDSMGNEAHVRVTFSIDTTTPTTTTTTTTSAPRLTPGFTVLTVLSVITITLMTKRAWKSRKM